MYNKNELKMINTLNSLSYENENEIDIICSSVVQCFLKFNKNKNADSVI